MLHVFKLRWKIQSTYNVMIQTGQIVFEIEEIVAVPKTKIGERIEGGRGRRIDQNRRLRDRDRRVSRRVEGIFLPLAEAWPNLKETLCFRGHEVGSRRSLLNRGRGGGGTQIERQDNLKFLRLADWPTGAIPS